MVVPGSTVATAIHTITRSTIHLIEIHGPGHTFAVPRAGDFRMPQNENHDKWGWVIYRTTYDDDEGWTCFKQLITQQSLTNIAESKAPEIADSLEWMFVEDRATLDRCYQGQPSPSLPAVGF